MKVAILSESPSDELAVRILLEALLEETVESSTVRARAGGVDAAIGNIRSTLLSLHYQQTAEALAVVVDTDNTIVHQPGHDEPRVTEARCRHCEVRGLLSREVSRLEQKGDAPSVRTAVGTAPPAIEAWLLSGTDNETTEAGWLQRQARGISARSETDALKKRLYGDPETRAETERMTITEAAARRIAADIAGLEWRFPNTFGPFAADVRGWRSP